MSDAPLLLVTTTRAAWLLDTGSGEATLIDEGHGVYYGISFSEDMIFIACRQAEVGGDRNAQDNAILCFDTSLRPVGVLRPPVPIRDVHQVCYHGGTLFACSTYDDTVFRYAVAERDWTTWCPFGEGRAQDRHHINSVTAGHAGILLAGNRPSGWFARFSRDGAPDTGVRHPLGVGTHNVWLQKNGVVTVCSSDEGALRSEDGGIQPVIARGWVRGYAQDQGFSYVGVSQNLVRGVRERSDCMVLRRDPSGVIDATFAFVGFGMLHDLRLVGRADQTHNGIVLRLDDSARAPGWRRHQTQSTSISLVP